MVKIELVYISPNDPLLPDLGCFALFSIFFADMVSPSVIGGCNNKTVVGPSVDTSVSLHEFSSQEKEPSRFNIWRAFVDQTREDFLGRIPDPQYAVSIL